MGRLFLNYQRLQDKLQKLILYIRNELPSVCICCKLWYKNVHTLQIYMYVFELCLYMYLLKPGNPDCHVVKPTICDNLVCRMYQMYPIFSYAHLKKKSSLMKELRQGGNKSVFLKDGVILFCTSLIMTWRIALIPSYFVPNKDIKSKTLCVKLCKQYDQYWMPPK